MKPQISSWKWSKIIWKDRSATTARTKTVNGTFLGIFTVNTDETITIKCSNSDNLTIVEKYLPKNQIQWCNLASLSS